MSQRDRAQRRRSPRDAEYVARDRSSRPVGPPEDSSWAEGTRALIEAPRRQVVSGIALVPLRIFLGVTFVYAGLDKLIDPAFLRDVGPGSIGAQMEAFVHTSPLAPIVVAFGQPFPIAVGAGIALLEIAIGVGTLTGLLFRACAAAGAALAILFWLTASWAIKPYYYGPDLPFAIGWITLALAGTGGMFTIQAWLPWSSSTATPRDQRQRRLAAARGRPMPETDDGVTRRAVLEAGLIGAAAVVLASLGAVVGPIVRGRDASALGPSSGSSTALSGASAAPLTTADAGAAVTTPRPTSSAVAPTGATAGTPIGSLTHLRPDHPIGFIDPTTGDPSAVLLLPNGKVVAYDLTCTHAGCTVEYDPSSGLLICPCHGATFDPTHGARAIAGPTDQPLAGLSVHVDRATGQISLTTS